MKNSYDGQSLNVTNTHISQITESLLSVMMVSICGELSGTGIPQRYCGSISEHSNKVSRKLCLWRVLPLICKKKQNKQKKHMQHL